MSLKDRIKKAKAKADKLSRKAKEAKSKGKDKRAANLEKRSENKTGKADKLAGKIGEKVMYRTSQSADAKKIHTTLQRKYNAPDLSKYNPLPLANPKSGPKDTSYKKSPAPYHGNTKDTGGKPPKSINKKNKK